MKIAVNTRLLLPKQLDGIGRFASETLKILTHKHKEHEFFFIFDRPFSEEFIFSDNIKPIVKGPFTRHSTLIWWWFEISIPWVLSKIKPDIFLSPDGFLSLSTGFDSIPVMHDLNFRHFPQYLPLQYRLQYNYFFPKYASKAKRIITVSEFSRQDISKHFRVPLSKIDVACNAASVENSEENAAIPEKFKNQIGEKPYFIFISTLHPRKNIAGLLKAYDIFRDKTESRYKLLLVGRKMWWDNEMEKTYTTLKNRDDVVFTGRVSDSEMSALLKNAFALVYPSFFEGFGIPVLDAMSSGIPVITSDVSSLPEIAGKAALFCNPHNPESIAERMLELVNDEGKRKALADEGRLQAAKYSWQKSAEVVWESILKAKNLI